MAMTPLLKTLSLLYSMQAADTDALFDTLMARRVDEWVRSISQELARYGCPSPAKAPTGENLQELVRLSERDAKSITSTYNRQLQAELQRLYTANPRGNRQYYYSNLEAWAAKRDRYKVPQIALQTASTTREYAQRRFRAENAIGGKYVFSGPAPTCAKCTQLKAMGAVGINVVQRYGNSQHINCPHEWVEIRPKRINCATAWKGA